MCLQAAEMEIKKLRIGRAREGPYGSKSRWKLWAVSIWNQWYQYSNSKLWLKDLKSSLFCIRFCIVHITSYQCTNLGTRKCHMLELFRSLLLHKSVPFCCISFLFWNFCSPPWMMQLINIWNVRPPQLTFYTLQLYFKSTSLTLLLDTVASVC